MISDAKNVLVSPNSFCLSAIFFLLQQEFFLAYKKKQCAKKNNLAVRKYLFLSLNQENIF